MSNNDIRTLLERACAKAVDVMLSGDDVATVRQGTDHHVVTIRTVESEEREARTLQRREEHAAADVDALRAEVTRQTGIAVDHCARADAAEQMVVELRELVGRMEAKANAGWLDDDHACVECVGTASPRWVERWTCARHSIDAAPSRTEAVAGRWVSHEVHEKSKATWLGRLTDLAAERDAAIAARDEAVRDRDHYRAKAAVDSTGEMGSQLVETAAWGRAEKARADAAVGALRHTQTQLDEAVRQRDAAIAARDEAVAKLDAIRMSHDRVAEALAAAERARDEVGIQLAAAQAEIARLTKGLREVERFMLAEWRPPAEAVLAMVRDVAAGGPSVPGDALAPRITAALEASGIDTANVKGVE